VIIVIRPYLKFLIAGGVLSGEGGSALVSGLELIWTSPLLNSLSSLMSSTPPAGAILVWEGIAYLVGGIVSIIIGLPLLFIGISRRKQYLASHAQESAQGIAEPGGWRSEPTTVRPESSTVMQMKWDLSFCIAEIEGNELLIQLKQKYRTIKQSFKLHEAHFKYRSILENFGYDIFKKALKKRVVSLTPERIDQFKVFFNTIQADETPAIHAEPRPADLWQVNTSEKAKRKGDDFAICTKCGAKLPESFQDLKFCPECGAPIVS